MSRPAIMLAEQEVPLGVRVHAYLPGSDEPLRTLHTATPYLFSALYGGVPARRRLYNIDGNSVHLGFEGFSDDMRFSPAIVYTTQDAPAGEVYYAFVNGAKVTHDLCRRTMHDYKVVKNDTGRLYQACSTPFELIERGRLLQLGKPDWIDEISDGKLVDTHNGWAKSNDSYKLDKQAKLIMALARKHGFVYTELIPLLQQLEGILVEVPLPTNTELVPYEGKNSTYDFEKLMSIRARV